MQGPVIKSPYNTHLVISGLVQQDLKHNWARFLKVGTPYMRHYVLIGSASFLGPTVP
jgi:hypothetical protein